MLKIKEYDVIELDNSGWFYQVECLDDFVVKGEKVISMPTLVYDYAYCEDSDYAFVKLVRDVASRITAVYRKKNGKLELIYKKEVYK